MAAGGSGSCEARFQPVADSHQSVDLGDDTMLFDEGWDRKHHLSKIRDRNVA
jgi:hypothetical protein